MHKSLLINHKLQNRWALRQTGTRSRRAQDGPMTFDEEIYVDGTRPVDVEIFVNPIFSGGQVLAVMMMIKNSVLIWIEGNTR